MLNDYEELFNEVQKIFHQVPSRFKYELNTVLYPTLVLVYLRMIASGKFRRGKTFVESAQRCIDHSQMPRIDKLMTLQCSADLPRRARKLLAGDKYTRIKVVLCEQSYDLLLDGMEEWTPTLQAIFLRHFKLIENENDGVPCQQTRMGCAVLDKLQKDDEEHRVPLSCDNLPSTYLYNVCEQTEIVICATFSSKNTMLAIGTKSGSAQVSSLTSAKLVQVKSAKSLEKLDTSTPGIDERMMDAGSQSMLRKLYGHQGPVYGCAFEPHDHFLLTASHDRTVRCWCLFTWSCVVIYPGHMAPIYSVCYAPSGYYFATASDDRTARIWTQDSRKSLCVLVGHLAHVICCKFHPNRHYLATGSADCTARLWDIIKGVQVRLFTGHRDEINALAFSTCGRYMVTGSRDHYIIVWDIEKENLVQALAHHTAAIRSIVFALDSKIFMAGAQDCQLTIWNFERLVQEYDSDQIRKLTNSKRNSSKLKSEDLLVESYATRGSPFFELRITSRNLLLAICSLSQE
ncbi:hypothetical protein KR093_001387, partial [Drosophila rubida]